MLYKRKDKVVTAYLYNVMNMAAIIFIALFVPICKLYLV